MAVQTPGCRARVDATLVHPSEHVGGIVDSTRPPWPGARPDDYDFPHVEAARAATAARDLADDLRRMATTVDDDAADLVANGFTGVFADWVTTRVGHRHDGLDDLARALDDQADRIDDLRTAAQQAARARDVQISSWTWQYRQWRDWTPDQATA